MKTPETDLSAFFIPIRSSSASPRLAASIALSKLFQLSSGVPVFSLATTNPSWSITKARGIDWAE